MVLRKTIFIWASHYHQFYDSIPSLLSILQTALEFAQVYRNGSGQSLVPDYAYYVFDAIWATAMALNNSSEVNNTGEVRRAFGNLEFTGVSVSLSSYKVT